MKIAFSIYISIQFLNPVRTLNCKRFITKFEQAWSLNSSYTGKNLLINEWKSGKVEKYNIYILYIYTGKILLIKEWKSGKVGK